LELKVWDHTAGGFLPLAAVGMDVPGDGYAEEVEEEHGAGEEAHAEGILHGADDGGDDEDGEDGVAEVAQQEFGVDDAEEGEEEDEDGKFEADAEAEDDGKEEACVFVDREHVDGSLCRSRRRGS
jgi:hypothetical protein